MTEVWNDGMEKPTASPVAALRFVAETILALGILVRATVHTVLVSRDVVEGDKEGPMEVTYRLGTGFAVKSPDVPTPRELEMRLLSMAVGFMVAGVWVGRMDFGDPLVAIAAANWGYLTADPLWFAAERLSERI